PGIPEVSENIHSAFNRSAYGFFPARVPRGDGLVMVGKFFDALAYGLLERTSCILQVIPLGSADIAEEPLNLFLGPENFSIKVTRVPVDENPAEVEDDGIDRLLHTCISPAKIMHTVVRR